MKPARAHPLWLPWAAAVGALALGAAWLLSPSTRDEPAPPPHAAVEPLPLPQAVVPGPASAASVAAHVSGTANPPAILAASGPARQPAIGSEGYGPHIEQARAGEDPQAAWDAVRWLRDCASNEARRGNTEQVRNQGVAPEFMTERLREIDAEARLCQTVTPQHRAWLAELSARAMRAGVPEAASAYASAVFPGDLTPEQRREVADAMRRDAASGHGGSLLAAITAHEAWGLRDEERLAYLIALAGLRGEAARAETTKALMASGALRFKASFTPEQLEAAKEEGERILARIPARREP